MSNENGQNRLFRYHTVLDPVDSLMPSGKHKRHKVSNLDKIKQALDLWNRKQEDANDVLEATPTEENLPQPKDPWWTE